MTPAGCRLLVVLYCGLVVEVRVIGVDNQLMMSSLPYLKQVVVQSTALIAKAQTRLSFGRKVDAFEAFAFTNRCI